MSSVGVHTGAICRQVHPMMTSARLLAVIFAQGCGRG
jgi:hypothetical protein